MFSVIIVEDELLVSIGIKNMIDWGKMNMCVVGEAQNGQDAYELYLKEKPDLILTDIKMPVMDGLEFISRIRENDKQTKIIILTSYDEFDLVHKALKLGVSDYILKMKMSPVEMESVMRKVWEELKKESASRVAGQDFFVDPQTVKEKAFKDFILYQSCTDREIDILIQKMGLRLTPSRMIFCIMSLNNYQDMRDRFDAKHGQTVRKTILDLIDKLLQNYRLGEIMSENEGRYWILVSFGNKSVAGEQALLNEILERIGLLMKTYINSSVSFGLSGCYDGYESLGKMYAESLDALDQGYFLQDSMIVHCNTDNQKSYLSLMENFRDFISQQEGINEEYRREITRGIGLLKGMFRKPKADIQEILIRWIHWPTLNMNAFGTELQDLALGYAKQAHECGRLTDAIEVFKKYLAAVVRMQNIKTPVSREITEVVQFIKNNYKQEISLQQAAGLVKMSSAYLSNLFKKEMGISFVEYINQVRIDRAKDLLVRTYLKTYEVALSVGFTDESYFSRIFKKLTGLRPYEYKKQPFNVGMNHEADDGYSS